MTRPVPHALLPFLLTLILASCATAGPRAAEPERGETTAVVVVRHAERAEDGTADPPLSAAGVERAQRLARSLSAAGVATALTTQYRRTRQTAEALNVPVEVRPVTGANQGSYAREIAAEITARYAGRTVVVVGHSNTVPELVAALGGGSIPPMAEDEYGRMYLLLIDPSGTRVFAAAMP